MNVTNPSMSAESASMPERDVDRERLRRRTTSRSRPIGIHVQSVATTPSWPWVSPHHAKIAAKAARQERIVAAGPMTA